eukprot:618995-Lingulodinium_polyedra.AAC.1
MDSLDSPRTVHGQSVGSPWIARGQSMDRSVREQSMDSPVHEQSMDSPVHEQSMGSPFMDWAWFAHGLSMDSPRTAHAQSMGSTLSMDRP